MRARSFRLVVESRELEVVVDELSCREPMLLLIVVRLSEIWEMQGSVVLAVPIDPVFETSRGVGLGRKELRAVLSSCAIVSVVSDCG